MRGERDRVVTGLTLAYIASAFGWRSWRQWKTTGDHGFRIGKSGSTPEKVVSALFAVSTVGGLAAGSRRTSRPPAVRGLGLALMGASLGGTLAAQVDLGQSWRIGVDPSERTDLVTDGAFAIVRNPIFTAMGGFAIGAALAVGSRTAQIAALAMLAAVELQVRLVEEPYLRDVHGTAYEEYCGRVGRFLPRVDITL